MTEDNARFGFGAGGVLGKNFSLRTRQWACGILLLAPMMLGGCKILTIEEDRALRASRSGGLDVAAYVNRIWAKQALPSLSANTHPMAQVVAAAAQDIDAAGAQFGRKVGEGSAWTFVVQGEGMVTRIDTASRRGVAEIAWSSNALDRRALVQIGPVVAGSEIRDALPFVTFNDFVDQVVFADVGTQLTRRALTDLKSAIAALQPGQRIKFTGVMNMRTGDAPLMLTPVSIALADRR